jgi:hypothetical protein
MKKQIIFRSVPVSILIFALSLSSLNAQENHSHKANKMVTGGSVDTALIEKVVGIKGKANKGEYKITIPQNDLNVIVDSFKIIPAMASAHG